VGPDGILSACLPPPPLQGTALYNQIVAMVNSFQVNGVLPANFFSKPLPANFPCQLLLPNSPAKVYGVAANSCDITKADGYKNYQLRNACVTSFGTLYNNSVPRFIQFGVKVCF